MDKERVEYDPISGLSKPLEIDRKYTALSNEGSKYIDLSLDLGSIGFPSKYHMLSYVQQNMPSYVQQDVQRQYEKFCDFPSVLDRSDLAFVPISASLLCGLRCVTPTWPSSK
jgi:hypothetical protein